MALGPMVHLTSVHHAFHARVLAARLGSDGIVTELRGALDGLYPIFGEIGIYVGQDDLPVARELLLADAVESCFDDAEAALPTASSPVRPAASALWRLAVGGVALAGVVVLVAGWFARAI